MLVVATNNAKGSGDVPAHTENFRQNNVRFLQEQNKQALSALQKVEEERNEGNS